MKLALASDLHLEFGPIELKNTEGAKVLLLSGDICVAQHIAIEHRASDRYRVFFENVSREFPIVLYVMGNHEHYHGVFLHTYGILQKFLSQWPNIHLMEKESYTLGETVFLSGTLWSDFNQKDPQTIMTVAQRMNDFQIVRYGDEGYGFSPQHAITEHEETLSFFHACSVDEEPEKKLIVVGHHAPSFRSVDKRYKGDTSMNGGYASNLEEFILTHPNIVLWTHGHMHTRNDYMIGGCRVVVNARGYYNYEPQAATFRLKYLEV